MASLKKKARDVGGKFLETQPKPKKPRGRPKVHASLVNGVGEGGASKAPPKQKSGRPRSTALKIKAPLSTFEVSIIISVGGTDIDKSLLSNVNSFLLEKTLVGKCAIERGGTTYNLHFQMVARLQAKSLISISRLLNTYLGWDKIQPAGGMVLCRKLTNKGLHTFHGLLGYCMKDASKDHFKMVDHHVSAEDLTLGMEQYVLHGREENKNRMVLTMQNLAERVFMWRENNCKHPAIVDFDRDIYEMLRTGKYYPATSWVIGGYGKGYETYQMQSLYRMMVVSCNVTI